MLPPPVPGPQEAREAPRAVQTLGLLITSERSNKTVAKLAPTEAFDTAASSILPWSDTGVSCASHAPPSLSLSMHPVMVIAVGELLAPKNHCVLVLPVKL